MRLQILLLPLIILCTPVQPFVGALIAKPILEFPVELVRIDSNKLYGWIVAPIAINTDFTLEVTERSEVVYSAHIAGVLNRVIVSGLLPDSVCERLSDSGEFDLRVYLESDLINDSLIIAVPDNLRRLWLDTLWVNSAEFPVKYRYRYFDDVREIEVAAKLKQIDLLIMPEFELADEKILDGSPFRVELNIICRDIKDDLFASALNYCSRGMFSKDGDFDYSLLIGAEQLANVFPRNLDYARELFRQTKKNKERLECSFPGVKMYPRLSERLNLGLDSCGPYKLVFRESAVEPFDLNFFVYELGEDSTAAYMRALREIVDPVRVELNDRIGERVDSCLLGTSNDADCRDLVSRVLAESARIIPLGRSRLAVKRFDHVRCLKDGSGSAKLSDFYTSRQ